MEWRVKDGDEVEVMKMVMRQGGTTERKGKDRRWR